nr:PREDICTED: alpha-1,2-mannosyltransferase ALG9 [Apteryx mantelli mantelli]
MFVFFLWTRPSGNKAGQVWAPEGSTAFKCLISARFCAALLSNISDCDETFNYWEPTHYLVYGKGFQTWEYSPAYAIRSYAYLWLHALPALFHARVLQTNKNTNENGWMKVQEGNLISEQYFLRPSLLLYVQTLIERATFLPGTLHVLSGPVFRKCPISPHSPPVFHEAVFVCAVEKGMENSCIQMLVDTIRSGIYSLHQTVSGCKLNITLQEATSFETAELNDFAAFEAQVTKIQHFLCVETDALSSCEKDCCVGTVSTARDGPKSSDLVAVFASVNLDLLAMLICGIADWRMLWTSDERFLSQFPGGELRLFKSFSLYPPSYMHDISFWVPDREQFDEVAFHTIARQVSHETVVSIQLIDSFQHSETARKSLCYRLTYQSCDKALSCQEVAEMQLLFRKEIQRCLCFSNCGKAVLTPFFLCVAAFLPSSFCMYTTMIAMTGWYMDKTSVAVLGVAAGALVGWPFSAALGLPIAFDLLIMKQRWKSFLNWCVVSLILFLVPLVIVDSYYYGKLVVAPLNIVLYNVFTSHGPDLYGTEPWSFYFINGFLNFNVAFILALLVLPLTCLMECLLQKFHVQNLGRPYWLTLAPMYIWIMIFFSQPHKEERFLFPIYPLICLCGAVALSALQKCYHFIFQRYRLEHYTVSSNWLALGTVFLFGLLSLSRSVALFRGYHGPLDLYPEFHRIATDPTIHTVPEGRPVNVCVGKEWYRFPSSFLLPDNWQLQFILSEFRGQLPKQFAKGPMATRIIPADMNDQNREEPSRYIDISKCHYLVDLDTAAEAPREPRYSSNKEEWVTIAYKPFLDASRSSKLLRAFYIPLLSEQHTWYANYTILKSRRLKQIRKKMGG